VSGYLGTPKSATSFNREMVVARALVRTLPECGLALSCKSLALKVLIAAQNRGLSVNVFPVWGLEKGIYLELSRCDSRNPNCADIKNVLFAGSACLRVHSEKPLLIVLEDLHWVGPSTVDLISAVTRRRAPGKSMLIGTYRPADAAVRQHPLKAGHQRGDYRLGE